MANNFKTIRLDLVGEALIQFKDVLKRINASINGTYSEKSLIVDVWKNGMLVCLTEVKRIENANKLC